jgi:hypothetical protein
LRKTSIKGSDSRTRFSPSEGATACKARSSGPSGDC